MSTSSSPLANAQRLFSEGRIAEAESAFELALFDHPTDLQALNVIGLSALRKGDTALALELLQRATQAHPNDALSHYHLGMASQAAGKTTEATSAYRASLQIHPAFFVARLHLAYILEQTGQAELAVVHYARALQDAQSAGRWQGPDTTPPNLRKQVEHAVMTVRTRRKDALAALLDPLARRYGLAGLSRIHKSLRIFFGEESPQYPDSRQRPTFLYVPDLPTTPYLSRELFPWLPAFEDCTSGIRAELRQVMTSSTGRERVFGTDELERQNLRGDKVAPSWNGYYFYRHGAPRDENRRACPITAEALETTTLCKVPHHGPEVLFSVYTRGTHLLPHCGVTNTRLVAHLPLIIPAHCALNVGGELHHWQEGRVVVFDDTYEHESWNRSEEMRVVLIFDIWNPYLSEVERLAVADIIVAIGQFREQVEAA